MKKIVLVLCVIFMLVPAVWAGGKKDSASSVKTVTIWDFKCGSGASKVAMEQIDALIEKNNPDIKINHVAQPDGDNYYQLVRAAVQAGEGPDIIMFHGGVQAYEFDPVMRAMLDYGVTELNAQTKQQKDRWIDGLCEE